MEDYAVLSAITSTIHLVELLPVGLPVLLSQFISHSIAVKVWVDHVLIHMNPLYAILPSIFLVLVRPVLISAVLIVNSAQQVVLPAQLSASKMKEWWPTSVVCNATHLVQLAINPLALQPANHAPQVISFSKIPARPVQLTALPVLQE